MSSSHERIFLDYASQTPIDPNVLEKMNAYALSNYANPSALYSEAIGAKEAMTIARGDCARVLGCQSSEIIFTSGGTESNNLALYGICRAYQKKGKTPHIITSTIEHSSVLEACKDLDGLGVSVTYIPVSTDGVISVTDIEKALTPDTVLISIMSANNEVGTIQPIRETVRMVKAYREKNNTCFPYVHTDACQSALYMSLDMNSLGVDLLTLDGIKMYGPRGMGLLYVRKGVGLEPLVQGGGQEGGLRSGTENVSGMIGLAYALDIADSYRDVETERLTILRDYAISEIQKQFPNTTLNGSPTDRLPNNINICFPDLDAEFAVISLDVQGIAVSYSSACRTLKEDSSSYVVEALGKNECASSSLRITMGRETTREHIDRLVQALQKVVE